MFHVKHNSLALYVHWPFCLAKCPYCDFNSHVAESIDHKAFVRAYLSELEHFASQLPGRELCSIFFGGGTPSLMMPETVGTIIEAAKKYWPHEKLFEVTLEANPTSSEAQKFRAFKDAGINRLSMGIQALNDEDLKFLGRQHTAKEAIAAIQMAKRVFNNFSFDLIYARPEQTVEKWRSELMKALSFETPHLSLYQLTIEKGTPFYAAHQRQEFTMPQDDTAAELYELTSKLAAAKGLYDYEVSNYAKPSFESKHNLVYWQYGEYLGIGPGAHSRLRASGSRRAMMMVHKPENWLATVNEKGSGVQTDEVLSASDALTEALMMGLRVKTGIKKETLQEFGKAFDDVQPRINALALKGLLNTGGETIAATPKGRMLLSSVMQELV